MSNKMRCLFALIWKIKWEKYLANIGGELWSDIAVENRVKNTADYQLDSKLFADNVNFCQEKMVWKVSSFNYMD